MKNFGIIATSSEEEEGGEAFERDLEKFVKLVFHLQEKTPSSVLQACKKTAGLL
jgi:hypothetical protein